MNEIMQSKKSRIGIFRGTFDPIHDGHLSFALKAIDKANLNYLYFLPEPNPLHKAQVSDLTHRLSMVSEAISPYEKIGLLDQNNLRGSIGQIIPELRKLFPLSTLVFLIGSDIARTLPKWPDLDSLCKNNEIIVALRNLDKKNEILNLIDSFRVKPSDTLILNAPIPKLSSSTVRQDISRNSPSHNIDNQVYRLIKDNKLYKDSK